ncbi:hypothetical protein M979_2498 [Buttiauxella noackiae ATCC 51607]|uniref:Uncharacterized protein n=1 Tax=Buttiauxella noackiae ATCC 51607 TaxID=1354255 RepID=A0A1B7HM99_9ENTR|nr:hypothetical protein [Buttiauxella noackiae]OAT16738.1 hypothetical protein M979_2498 [Buttiauxella noackiae ATCC 51607]
MSDDTEQKKPDLELLKIKVDIWKQVINTQQHFNDLAMKIRNFAILILSAFIGAIGISFKSGFALPFFGHSTSVSTILSFGAAIIWLLFFFVDVYWYHPLLIGAVKKGIAIEQSIGHGLESVIDLTQAIGKESPKKINFKIFNWTYFTKDLHSKDKAKLFYLGVFWILLISAIILAFVDTPDSAKKNTGENTGSFIKLQCKRTINYDGVDCTIDSKK